MAELHYDWNTWLKEWYDLLIEKLDPERYPRHDAATINAVRSGWLGGNPASEAQLQALEQRLGKRLPPSYRQFLRASNGFFQPEMLVPRLFAIDEVEWYRVHNQDTIDIWQAIEDETTGSVTEDEEVFFAQFLPNMLEISATELVGTAVYLLCPERINAVGEWEAYYFAQWIPGATRYTSFWELMQKEREYAERHLPLRHPDPAQNPANKSSFLKVMADAFRESWRIAKAVFEAGRK